MTYSDNVTPNVAATYNRLGQIATITDAVGSRTFSYNSVFGLTSEAISGLYSKTISRSYASSGVTGRYTGVNIGTEYSVAYDYDTYGRLNSLTNGADVFTYSYMANSNLLAGLTMPNTITVTNSYEANRNLLASVENKFGTTTVSKYDYVNNAIANRTSMAKSGTAFLQADTISYGYNDKSEVTSATAQNDTAYIYNYQFDNIGNRISATESGTSKAYTSNLLNQYTAITNPTTAPTYDDDGNMLNDGTWSLTWDAENRLTKAERTGRDKAEFTYDYMSRRVTKAVYLWTNGVWALAANLKFVYDGWNLIETLDGNNSNVVSWKHVWGKDLSGSLQGAGGVGGLLSTTDSSGTYYPLYDANGNIGVYLDSTGTKAACYEYSPLGKITSSSGTKANDFAFRFSTKYYDNETGLYYYGYIRYYSPELGRWLNRDSIEEDGGVNLYCFVGNNISNKIDKYGLTPAIDEPDNSIPNEYDNPAAAIEDARKEAVRKTKSKDSGQVEFCGLICEKCKDGKTITFKTGPVMGTPYNPKTRKWSCTPDKAPCPGNAKRVKAYHTHPPTGQTDFSQGDKDYAKNENVPLILFPTNPNGTDTKTVYPNGTVSVNISVTK